MRKCFAVVAVFGVLAMCVTASASPTKVDIARDGLAASEGAGAPLVTALAEEAAARGYVAKPGVGDGALVWWEADDSGYGHFLDDTPGTMQATRMIFGNGWKEGTHLSAWVARVYVSTYNFGAYDGTGSFYMELWDGDPLGVFDTTCSAGGVPAPIPGSGCTFMDLPESVVYDLYCPWDPAFKMGYMCDRVFGVVFPIAVCRWSWRLSQGYIDGSSGAEIGAGDGMEEIWACEQFGYCPTASGYNAGWCCDFGNETCDHTDPDPLNWTPPCNHPTQCQDAAADYYFAFYDEAPIYYNNFVGAVYAQTDLAVFLRPVAVDNPKGTFPGYAWVDGDAVVIDADGACVQHYIGFQITLPDWDPGATGLKLKAYEVGIDSAGYTAGLRGTLVPYQADCVDDADCIALFGPIGAGAAKGGCGVPGVPLNKCAAGYIDELKDDPWDFIFAGQAFLGGVDQSTYNYRYGATLLGLPIASPHTGDMYGGSLWLITEDTQHAGTFFVGIRPPPRTNMVDENSQFIQMLGVVGAAVDFPLGQCCNISVDPTVCVSDTVTRCECYEMGQAGGYNVNFDPDKTCDDPCIECLDDVACADGDACTSNACVDNFCEDTPVAVTSAECCDSVPADLNADLNGLGAIVSNVDGDQCTDDLCAPGTGCAVAPQCGVPFNPPSAAGTPCDDENMCTYDDICDGLDPPGCAGSDVNLVPCVTSDDCEAVTGVAFDCVGGYCLCVLEPPLNLIVRGSQKPNPNCFAVGETIAVDVFMGAAASVITGAQFVVEYDPACVAFNDIVPGGGEYTYEIAEIVDEATGTIFYAVGVDPFIGGGTNGNVILATMFFTKVGVCTNCIFCFGGENPMNTYLVDDTGQRVGVAPKCSKEIHENDYIWVDVPEDVEVNADCDAVTAMVTWDAPTAGSSCEGGEKPYAVNMDCYGMHESGMDMTHMAMGGGEHPQGVTTYECVATSKVCGDSIIDGWTVTVSDQQSLDVTLQVSPIIAAADLIRCFKFELFEDCVEPPVVIERDLNIGGLWDFTGHFTAPIKVPKGQYVCITARDQLHTLRACDYLECVDGVYYAHFKGDPFFGGNWLVGGNLDGWKKENPNASHDVIDILDFGQFVANYGMVYPSGDTPCSTPGPHADINGDGVVDELDFTFVTLNFLMSSKECCCGGGVAGVPVTSITAEEARAKGLSEVMAGDLDGDGVLDTHDMNLFSQGVRTKVKGDRVRGIR
jgi:hypothetical protein